MEAPGDWNFAGDELWPSLPQDIIPCHTQHSALQTLPKYANQESLNRSAAPLDQDLLDHAIDEVLSDQALYTGNELEYSITSDLTTNDSFKNSGKGTPPCQVQHDTLQTFPQDFSHDLLDNSGSALNLDFLDSAIDDTPTDAGSKPRCWDHGCNGREFSSKSNLTRHRKEKAGEVAKVICPLCSGIFTRTSTRDMHLAKQSCDRIRRYSNGRPRPSQIALMSNPNLSRGIHY